ncbi:uncharacterized protein LOC124268923 isoform X1 [Haliotis rubra]|uniref:uncharacterized protein LOC124268923 isoform X1 n=1 Tax=Haliotis rubra TaxID=36100 RepID=UPI001EE52090|nr:uncharacterized protein LOC124268923 isoform X1 [Haliotis rubra]
MLVLGLARCEDYSRFLVDIVEPTGVADVKTTMATVKSILQETAGVDFIFKVFGEPRVLAILHIPSLCDMRPVEDKLLVANLVFTVKSLFLVEKLAADLGVNRTLIASAPPPANLTGDHIYFWDVIYRMEDLTSEEYKEEIRDSLEESFKYRLDNHHSLMYRVLGGLPIQMMCFVPMEPEEAELVVWHFNRRKLIFTGKVVLVQNLDVYLKGCQ